MENLDSIIEKFKKINYSIKGNSNNKFLFDNKNNNTLIRVRDNHFSIDMGAKENSKNISLNIFFDRIKIEFLDEDCICLSDKLSCENTGFFINFYNH